MIWMDAPVSLKLKVRLRKPQDTYNHQPFFSYRLLISRLGFPNPPSPFCACFQLEYRTWRPYLGSPGFAGWQLRTRLVTAFFRKFHTYLSFQNWAHTRPPYLGSPGLADWQLKTRLVTAFSSKFHTYLLSQNWTQTRLPYLGPLGLAGWQLRTRLVTAFFLANFVLTFRLILGRRTWVPLA